jgi:hypothetical protein
VAITPDPVIEKLTGEEDFLKGFKQIVWDRFAIIIS